MKKLLNSFAFYFLFPAYFALLLLFVFFNIPESFHHDILMFYLIISLPVLCISPFIPLNLNLDISYQKIPIKPHYRFVVLFTCSFILFCAPLDIYINGFKMATPETYATMNGAGRYIRHVTILCWIFVPVAFIFLRSTRMKFFFISFALIFPILILDRNRLCISCYSLFFCMVFSASANKNRKYLYWLIPVACFAIFTVLGHYHKGNVWAVPSSEYTLQDGAYPLTSFFSRLPVLLQRAILYITTPIFNFATVVHYDFINQNFLLSQFSPFSRENYAAYPFSPIYVPSFNVGTELYPFLLYGGLGLVTIAFIVMMLSFLVTCLFFKRYSNIFSLLIFIRTSYNIIFMGFAPQFYILLNLMFVILMILLWLLTELIKIVTIAIIRFK